MLEKPTVKVCKICRQLIIGQNVVCICDKFYHSNCIIEKSNKGEKL